MVEVREDVLGIRSVCSVDSWGGAACGASVVGDLWKEPPMLKVDENIPGRFGLGIREDRVGFVMGWG